jgi:hypothetical protein
VKIDLKSLDASGFVLELPNDASPADEVSIAHAHRLGGVYVQDARRFRVEGLHAEAVSLASLTWHLASGRVVAGEGAELSAPSVDLDIPRGEAKARRGTQGRVALAGLRVPDLSLELGELQLGGELARGLELRLGMKGEEVALQVAALAMPHVGLTRGELSASFDALHSGELELHHGAHATTAKVADLGLSKLSLRSGALELAVAELRLTKARFVRTDTGSLELHAADVELVGLSLSTPSLRVAAARVALHGVAWVDGELSLERVAVDRSELALELGAASEPAPAAVASSRRSARRAPIDLSFLDLLDGRVDVDVHVDAKVPYLKRRRATHHFRVALKAGTLDYAKLEGDLSALEDALLDFAIRKGNLVLEVSPPLLSFARKTIVEWPLDDAGRELAQAKLVRLATLARPRLPPKKPGAGASEASDDAFSLDRLDFDPIEVDLHLGGPAQVDLGPRGIVHLGAGRRTSIGRLLLRGELHHRAEHAAKQPTTLVGSAAKLRFGLEAVPVGERVLGASDISLESIDEVRITANGLSPTRLIAKLGELSIRRMLLG